MRRINRAYFGTGSAIDALILVNNVFIVTFRNARNRAFRFTRTTTDAIVIDKICQFLTPPHIQPHISGIHEVAPSIIQPINILIYKRL